MSFVPPNGAALGSESLEKTPFSVHDLGVPSLVLTPLRAEYPEGSIPDFRITIRNTTAKPARLCTYMLHYRLMLAMTARIEDGFEYGLYPFRKGQWEKFQARHFRTLAPGKELTEALGITEGTQNGGWAFARTGDQPPILTWKYRIVGFPAGTYTFTTCLLARMALYKGLDGAYDKTLESRALPEQIQGLQPGDYSDVVRSELTAIATVKFTKKA